MRLVNCLLFTVAMIGPVEAADYYRHIRGENSSHRYDLHRAPAVTDSTGSINQNPATDPGDMQSPANQHSLDNPNMDCSSKFSGAGASRNASSPCGASDDE
jgi:hypothetical protein